MITYRGLPAPIICDFLSREASRALYAPGTEFHIGNIELVANTGTYVDCPFHRFADGADLSELPLERWPICTARRGRDARSGRSDRWADAFARSGRAGKAVLVHTGWDRHWRTDAYFEGHPFLTEAAAGAPGRAGAHAWSASTRSTSTTPPTGAARSTPRCSARDPDRRALIGWMACPTRASASSRSR